MLDLDFILNWIRENPMKTEFMLLEIIKNFNVEADINNGLLFIKIRKDNLFSVLVTNRYGEDIFLMKDIEIDLNSKLSYVALKYKDVLSYSSFNNSKFNSDTLYDLDFKDGDYMIYSDGIINTNLVLTKSQINSKIHPVEKRKKLN